MSKLVTAVAGNICSRCHAKRCNKKNCSVSMQKAPTRRVVVDLDCDDLQIPGNQKRCDYLFVGEENNTTWVVPIELKSGGLKAQDVVDQIQAGAGLADAWLPQEGSFQFVPVLAHGKGIHSKDLQILRDRKIKLRGQKKQTVLVRCGRALKEVLN